MSMTDRRLAMAVAASMVLRSAMAALLLVFLLFVTVVLSLHHPSGYGGSFLGGSRHHHYRPSVFLSPLRGLKEDAPEAHLLQEAENGDASSKGFARPDYSIYHARESVHRELKALVDRHPDIMRIEALEGNEGGYSVRMQVVTVELEGGLMREGWTTKTRALLDFGQHGREIITTEVALSLLKALAGEDLPDGIDYAEIKRFCQNMVIKIVPMENENGRSKVESGELCERKNGRGVDINRNWDIDWGKREKDYDPSEEYPGTAPFSEPEASIIRNLTLDFRPHVWVNVHSGMEALFMPYDHKGGTPLDGSAPVVTELLDEINNRHCGRRCKVGSGGGSVGYLAHGTATDYMYDVLKVPISLTWEIYGDSNAHNDDCFRMFNPTTRPAYNTVVLTWTSAFITLLGKLPETLQRLPRHTHSVSERDSDANAAFHQRTDNAIEISKGVGAIADEVTGTSSLDHASQRQTWSNEADADGGGGDSDRGGKGVYGVEPFFRIPERALFIDAVRSEIIGGAICLVIFLWLVRTWYHRRILQWQRIAGKKDALV